MASLTIALMWSRVALLKPVQSHKTTKLLLITSYAAPRPTLFLGQICSACTDPLLPIRMLQSLSVVARLLQPLLPDLITDQSFNNNRAAKVTFYHIPRVLCGKEAVTTIRGTLNSRH